MKMRLFVALCILSIAQVSGQAQSRTDLDVRYRSLSRYEIRPGILMTARFSGDGQVCEMVLEKAHLVNGQIYLGSSIPKGSLDDIFAEVAPAAERGAPARNSVKSISETTSVSGNLITTERAFENVSFTSYGNTTLGESLVAVVKWTKRTCADSTGQFQGNSAVGAQKVAN